MLNSGFRAYSQDRSIGISDGIQRLESLGDSVALHTSDPLLVIAAVAFCYTQGKSLLLGHPNVDLDVVRRLFSLAGARQLVTGSYEDFSTEELQSEAPSPSEPRLGILTSGTTGIPKLAWHRWDTVSAPALRVPERLQKVGWLMTYGPTTFAGIQVILSALLSEGELWHSGGRIEPAVQAMETGRVAVVSATPTFWRLLVSSWPSETPRPKLRQATLGGEYANQSTLDLVAGFFQPEKLTHIYASTEVGTAIVVSDGKEGFPISVLENEGPVSVKIDDGRLAFKSPYSMQGYVGSSEGAQPDGWYVTKDLVDIVDGRIRFVGRADGIINIGGSKINPEAIEAVLMEIEGVSDCRVYGRKNPITGQVLAADLVLASDSGQTVQSLRQTMKDRLPAGSMPQMIKIVPRLETNASGKKVRTVE